MNDYPMNAEAHGIAAELARDARDECLREMGVLRYCAQCEKHSEHVPCSNVAHGDGCVELCACGHHTTKVTGGLK